ncbi:MAG: hypothetical protein ACREPX_13670 [Rhodanobacteraceae bacterium]
MKSIPLDQVLGLALVAASAIAIVACKPSSEPPKSAAAASTEVRDFEGSWNAAGTRRTIPLGAGRKSSIINLRGTMLLAGKGRPGVGFRSDVIALTDSETGLVGRSVWTDERGDEVFSTLEGQGTAAKNRMSGTIFGGTGRYAGATGSYEFSWQYVIELEDGTIQGSSAGLTGRIQVGAADAGTAQP